MGIFCVVLGCVIFVAALVVGWCFASLMSMQGILNVIAGTEKLNIKDLFRLPASGEAGTYIGCIAAFGFLGLLLGMGVFMSGLIYSKLNSIEYYSRKAARRG